MKIKEKGTTTQDRTDVGSGKDNFRKQLMRTKAELRLSKNYVKNSKKKIAYLEEGKGMELTLNREKKIVRRLRKQKAMVLTPRQRISAIPAQTTTKNQ